MKPPSTPAPESTGGGAPARRSPGAPPRRRAAAPSRAYGRRLLIALVLLAAAIAGVAAVSGERGWLDVRRQRAELLKLRAEVGALQRENRVLLDRVRGLRGDPFVLEAVAREKLGYARPGEIVLEFPPSNPSVPETPPPRPAPGG